MRVRGVLGAVLCGMLAVVPACLGTARGPGHTPAAGGGAPSANVTPSAAFSAPEVMGISLRNWTSGHRPYSRPGDDCGVKEAFIDVDKFIRPDDQLFDRTKCFANVGCPAREAVVWPRCTTSPVPLTEMADFLADEARWADGTRIRMRGRLFLTDPHYRDGFSHTLPFVDGQEPGCYDRTQRRVSLPLRRGDECHQVAIWSASSGPLCMGDLSRSCCGDLPMGEMIQASGILRVRSFQGSFWGEVDLADICVE